MMTTAEGNTVVYVRNQADVAEFMATIKPSERVRLTFHSTSVGVQGVYCLKEMIGELFSFEPSESEWLEKIRKEGNWAGRERSFVAKILRVSPTVVASVIGRSLASIEVIRAAE